MSCKCDERTVCYCDGPHGPLSDVYYDEGGYLASVYAGDRRYRISMNRDGTYMIVIDATHYDASNNARLGREL